MSDMGLLSDLASVGIRLHRDGGDLVAEIPPGTNLDLFRERIRQNKPALLAALANEGNPTSQTLPDPRVLTAADAEAIGLDPALPWIRVYTGPVEASKPPEGWDGTLPAECGWPNLCRQLGPCPRHLTGGPCVIDGSQS